MASACSQSSSDGTGPLQRLRDVVASANLLDFSNLPFSLPLTELGIAWLQGGTDALIREGGAALFSQGLSGLMSRGADPSASQSDPDTEASATSLLAAFRLRLGETNVGARVQASCQFHAMEGACSAGYGLDGNDWSALARRHFVKWLAGAFPAAASADQATSFEFAFSFKTARAPVSIAALPPYRDVHRLFD